MNRTDKIMKTAWMLWGSLGIYRGHRFYVNDYNERKKWNKTMQYYYITNIGFSILGGSMYVFPLFMPGTVINELYNLEETIRGIKSDD